MADIREEKISKFDDIVIKTEEKNILKSEQSIIELWENFKRFHIIWIFRGEDSGDYRKIFEEIMVESFPNFIKPINPQVHEAPWILKTRIPS